MNEFSIKQWMVAVLATWISATASADIYRWVDKEGNIHYSDQQPKNSEVTVEKKIYPNVATPFRRPPPTLYQPPSRNTAAKKATAAPDAVPEPPAEKKKQPPHTTAPTPAVEKRTDDEPKQLDRRNKRHLEKGQKPKRLSDKKVSSFNRGERVKAIKKRNQSVLKKHRGQ